MDWSMYRCGRIGHITYAPDEPELRRQVRATTASAELWCCLRCGTFVPGLPDGSGSAAQAPKVKRGKQIRGDLILKLFSIERFLRFLIFGAVAYGVWHFRNDQITLTQAFNREVHALRSLFDQFGFNLDHSSIVNEFRKLLHLTPTNLTIIAILIAALSLISLAESYALWTVKRWGEYFALIVTSLGLPLEIYELVGSVTALKVILFLLNIVLVVYLVTSRRLFGARGGKEAYEARLRHESVLDEAAKAAAATPVQALPAADASPTGPASPNGPASPTAASPAANASPASAGDRPPAAAVTTPVPPSS